MLSNITPSTFIDFFDLLTLLLINISIKKKNFIVELIDTLASVKKGHNIIKGFKNIGVLFSRFFLSGKGHLYVKVKSLNQSTPKGQVLGCFMPTGSYITSLNKAKRARLNRSSIRSILLALDIGQLSTDTKEISQKFFEIEKFIPKRNLCVRVVNKK